MVMSNAMMKTQNGKFWESYFEVFVHPIPWCISPGSDVSGGELVLYQYPGIVVQSHLEEKHVTNIH